MFHRKSCVCFLWGKLILGKALCLPVWIITLESLALFVTMNLYFVKINFIFLIVNAVIWEIFENQFNQLNQLQKTSPRLSLRGVARHMAKQSHLVCAIAINRLPRFTALRSQWLGKGGLARQLPNKKITDLLAPSKPASSKQSEEIKAKAGIVIPNTIGQLAPKEKIFLFM